MIIVLNGIRYIAYHTCRKANNGQKDRSLSAVLWWLVVGLIAGFLASLVGIGAGGFIGTIIIAFIDTCILIAILRAVSGGFGRLRVL
jgi:hypothetical protein